MTLTLIVTLYILTGSLEMFCVLKIIRVMAPQHNTFPSYFGLVLADLRLVRGTGLKGNVW